VGFFSNTRVIKVLYKGRKEKCYATRSNKAYISDYYQAEASYKNFYYKFIDILLRYGYA
jgi:hypothetical protein